MVEMIDTDSEVSIFIGKGPDFYERKITLAEKTDTKIGKAGTNHIIISDDEEINDLHCMLHYESETNKIWVIDKSSSFGVFYRVPRMSEFNLSRESTELPILIGSQTYCVLKPDTLNPKGNEFILEKWNYLTKTQLKDYKITKEDIWRVGRDPADNIFISVEEDSSVSAFHMQLYYKAMERKWCVVDKGRNSTGSTNGVWVRCFPDIAQEIKIGNSLRIGANTYIHFRNSSFIPPVHE